MGHHLIIISILIITIVIIHHYCMFTSYTFPGQSEFKVLLTEKPARAVGPTNQVEPALPKGSHPVGRARTMSTIAIWTNTNINTNTNTNTNTDNPTKLNLHCPGARSSQNNVNSMIMMMTNDFSNFDKSTLKVG